MVYTVDYFDDAKFFRMQGEKKKIGLVVESERHAVNLIKGGLAENPVWKKLMNLTLLMDAYEL